MGAVPVRSTSHTIGDQVIKFSVLAPTNDDPTTREVIVSEVGGAMARLRFNHDDFQLFKSILKEF